VAGEDIERIRPELLRRRMGYVIQSIGLFPHLTVLDNIRVVPGLLGWDAARSERRALDLLRLFGLDPDRFRDRYPAELSGGQAQRVGVARALAADPEVLLMDEPFGALDPISRERLQTEFAKIQSELRKTIVFVTHDVDEAVRLGTRIAIMDRGRIVQCDTPEALLCRPAGEFVKRFLGTDRALKRLSLLPVREAVRPAGRVGLAGGWPQVLEAFARHPEAVSVWVTDEDGRVLGWLNRPAGRTAPGEGEVLDRMTAVEPEGFQVPAGASLKQALNGFIRHGVAALPVADEQGRMLGEVRLADLLARCGPGGE
jgi:osmoprotectant transport system ATP-binding protein